MEYRRLGKSGLKVSVIGLGANNFGGRAEVKPSEEVMDYALANGINFIDTSASYADGKSEEIVGKAVKGRRQEFAIATKFGTPRYAFSHEQPASRTLIMRECEASLKRLQTDYIDLYYLHYPDPNTPIEETLRAMDALVQSGKVRYLACSNFQAWQLASALWTSKHLNLESFVAIQPRYNMLDRHIEPELVPCCQEFGVGVIPWGPLASGFLTGKYKNEKEMPKQGRLVKPISIYSDVVTPENWGKLEKLTAFATGRGHTIAELAIGWLMYKPWISSVIIGAMTVEQQKQNMQSFGWKLTASEMQELDKII